VIALGPHRPAPPDGAIDGPRDPDRKTLHAAGKAVPIARFDNEVHVVRLHRKVQQTKCAFRRTRERRANGLKHHLLAQ